MQEIIKYDRIQKPISFANRHSKYIRFFLKAFHGNIFNNDEEWQYFAEIDLNVDQHMSNNFRRPFKNLA